MIFAERFWGAEVDREVVYEVYVGVCAWYSIGMLGMTESLGARRN